MQNPIPKHFRIFIVFSSLLIIGLVGANCKKHKTKVEDPVSQLPPETQVGANTFGCLVDGKVFVPKGSPFSGPKLQCAYQYLDNEYSKGFYFQLSASYNDKPRELIGVYTEDLEISVGEFDLMDSFQEGKAYGFYMKFTDSGRIKAYTESSLPGQLHITKFDEINQIVSGTFGFSVVVNSGDTIHVTDGRFDMQFTR